QFDRLRLRRARNEGASARNAGAQLRSVRATVRNGSPVTAGYSGTPLPKKLGLKAGIRVHVSGAPMDYEALIGGWPADVVVLGSRGAELDFVHVFVRAQKELATQLPKLRKRIQP